MSARSEILGAIRAANRSGTTAAGDIAKEAAELVAEPAGVQPDFGTASLVERFVAKATSERVTATVEHLGTMSEVPRAVTKYLDQVEAAHRVAVQPCSDFNDLDWTGYDLNADCLTDGGTAVTLAEYGVAETGSVVFRSGKDAPILLNFLPLHHIVVLRTENLVAHPEDLWPMLGGRDAPQSRLLTLVTGTSGTADIEAKNVRGAHGPRHMHILLVAP